MRKQYVVHIDTPAGARFSTHDSHEDMRRSLVEYYNEVHADGSPIPEDSELEEAIEKIEELENVSWEENWLPAEKVWVFAWNSEYDTSVTLHKTEDEALEDIASFYQIDIEGVASDVARERIEKHLDGHDTDWFILEEKELPA